MSDLKFNQPVRGFRKNCEFRQLATNHRYLVAGMESWADVAIFVNLVGQVLALRGRETQASKEFWSARKQAGASHAMLFSLREQRLHQMSAAAFALLKIGTETVPVFEKLLAESFQSDLLPSEGTLVEASSTESTAEIAEDTEPELATEEEESETPASTKRE